MQVRADELIIGDRAITSEGASGTFCRTVTCLAAAIDPPHAVTVYLDHAEIAPDGEGRVCTIPADFVLTVQR